MPNKSPRRYALVFAACAMLPASGADYNIRLLTDSTPDLTDIESYVRSIADNWKDPQDKAIAVWRWGRRCRHQTQCAGEDGRLIWDPILHFTSYGFMNCGIIAALNISAALKVGFQTRYVELGDHTVSEFSWDGRASWHLFDSSMSVFCLNHQGVVAGCEEIKAEAACALSGGRVEPGHCYLYHPAPPCASHRGPTGWRCASDNPVEFNRTLHEGASSYTDGFTVSRYSQMAQWGRRYILNLKPGETYTRYWRLLGTDRRYMRTVPGEKDAEDPAKNGITRTVRASGSWEFRPDLASSRWADIVWDAENLQVGASKPHYAPRLPGEACAAVFKVDAANVITSMRIEAAVQCAGPGSELRLLVSKDAGLAWTEVWKAAGQGREEVRREVIDEVAGHTEALVKFAMRAGADGAACGLDALAITTFTQVNRLTLPRLVRGTNRVQVRLGDQTESLVLWPVLHAGGYRRTVGESTGIFTQDVPDHFYRATLGAGINDSTCSAVWRLPVPTDVARLTVGARVCNRGGGYVSLQYSWDGKDYRELYRKSDGAEPFDIMVVRSAQPEAATRCAWVKGEFYSKESAGTYNTTGIEDIVMDVAHRPRSPGFEPIEVTFCWTEYRTTGHVERRHTQLVTAAEQEWRIVVGGVRDPAMRWVRLRLQGPAGDNGGERPGYSDGEVAPPGSERARRVAYTWGRNIASGAPYTASRPSCEPNGDGGGKELTNDIVIAPTDYFASQWPAMLRAATAGWDGEVTFVLDLGAPKTIGGVRVWTHQPNATFCHPERVEVSFSIDGSEWRAMGAIAHDDLWNPPGDYEPWEGDDDPAYAALPAGGRSAYGFPLVCAPGHAQARFVRFHFTPLSGRSIGISELQIFDTVSVRPWPGEIALPPVPVAQ